MMVFRLCTFLASITEKYPLNGLVAELDAVVLDLRLTIPFTVLRRERNTIERNYSDGQVESVYAAKGSEIDVSRTMSDSHHPKQGK